MFPHNSQTYNQFHKAIAIAHIDIQHNPDRSQKQVGFTEIYMSSDPFDKLDISTLLSDVKSVAKYPMMISVGNDWENGGSGSQTFAEINASFIILQKIDSKNPEKNAARLEAYSNTERIAQEISGFIKTYFEANVLLGHLVKMPAGEKTGPVNIDGQCFGCHVHYSYVSRYSNLFFNQNQFINLTPSQDEEPDETNF